MKGDFTRFTFASPKHYDAVLMQQGRVQTDADWNEQVMIAAHRNRTETFDIIGPTGAPQDLEVGGLGSLRMYWGPDAQLVNQLYIYKGRYYVDGLMVESEAPLQYTSQPGATLPPAQGAGTYLFYIDVWRRHITSLEDSGIREVALAGADSGTRSQLVWQVRAEKVAALGVDVNSIDDKQYGPGWQPANTASTGLMDAAAGSTPLENQLYRVEIHRGGTADTASCKWSRDNGTIVARVVSSTPPVLHGLIWQFSIEIDRTGRDSFSSFLPGQMVELSNDAFVLQRKPGVFGTITSVVGNTLFLQVPQPPPPQAGLPLDVNDGSVNPLKGAVSTVRRWDNLWNPDDVSSATLLNVGPDYTTPGGRLVLERDITVKFVNKGGELYRTGDFWLIPARTVSGLVDWETNVPQRSVGEEHSYAPLALAGIQANGKIANPVTDLRDMRKVFPSLRSLVPGSGGLASGTPTQNYVPKWKSSISTELVNSSITDDGATVSIAEQLKVGIAGAAVTITRFTAEAINTMAPANLLATVPTTGSVRTYVEGVVSGTPGRLSKFIGVHTLGDSLVSENVSMVTVAGSVNINSGSAATSTLNVLGATSLQNTLNVQGATSLQSTLKVGVVPTAVTITRFTSEAMSNADLAATVPTSLGVKTYVEGVVSGTQGRHAKFIGVHVLGDSLVSEAGLTVSVQGALSVDSGNAATSTLNVLGAATLKSTLSLQGVASLQSTLKVGLAPTAVTITRFTSEAMSNADVAATVPTSLGVKTYVEGIVNGSTGRHTKFVGAHALGDSLVSESASTVTVQGKLVVEREVQGNSTNSFGVEGKSVDNYAVYGVSTNSIGAYGWSENYYGVSGYSLNSFAGFFFGKVHINGNLTKMGGGFTIDHPLDSENRYLHHSFVESPDRKNLYDGIVVCDGQGEATVELPIWFDPLNRDLRYQLTALGARAPDLHVASETKEGRFKIAGGSKGLRVSWQLTGVRQDAWANANPLLVEEDKAADERGFFLHPESHGQPAERSIHHKMEAKARGHLKRQERAEVVLARPVPKPVVIDDHALPSSRAEQARDDLIELASGERIVGAETLKLTPRQLHDERRHDLQHYKDLEIARHTEAALAARRREVPDHELLYAAIGALDTTRVENYRAVVARFVNALDEAKRAIQEARSAADVDAVLTVYDALLDGARSR